MARFDVYESPDGAGYVVDVQADLLDMLQTRVVIPLMPMDRAPSPARRMNPVFEIENASYVLMTQYLATVPQSALKAPVGELREEAAAIVDAIDFVLQGF